jgi:lysophospholipase L1-like esterase
VPLLVTADTLQQPAANAFSPADMIHPNSAGAELIAQLLFDKLVELGWLEQ